MSQSRPTQSDVARAAGVSQTTVSIVLNRITGTQVRLSEETRTRVLNAIEETGYIVNPIARSLAGHRTNILGVFGFEPMFGSNSDSFYLPFMEGIEQAAEATGHDLLLFASAARDGSQHHIYRQNENRLRLVDGCILIGNGEPQLELSRLVSEGFPFVFIGRREVPGIKIPYVTADYFAATKEVVRRLEDLGHSHIVYMAASRGLPSSADRLAAVMEQTAELGMHCVTIFDDEPTHRADVLKAISDGATAIVAEPLIDIEELAEDLERNGLHFPSDISVAVLGDPLNTSRSRGFWSGYRLPRQEIGRSAVEMLLERLNTPEAAVEWKIVPCIPEKGKTIGAKRTDHGRKGEVFV